MGEWTRLDGNIAIGLLAPYQHVPTGCQPYGLSGIEDEEKIELLREKYYLEFMLFHSISQRDKSFFKRILCKKYQEVSDEYIELKRKEIDEINDKIAIRDKVGRILWNM